MVTLAALVAFGCTSPEEPRRDIVGTEKKLYSQALEELIIRDFFQDKEGGFFVDIGCAWPIYAGTTYYLEKHLGWRGLAVDALPQYRPMWEKNRPDAEFHQYAVTDRTGDMLTFYEHDWPAVSSLSKQHAALFGGEERLTQVDVPTITLNDLLDRAKVEKIDLISMDIEGAEPGALRGFDIERFAPELVCIEAAAGNGDFYLEYFGKHGYERIEKYAKHDKVNWYFRRAK
jgi:FkbM family methyltransferase